MVSIKHKVTLKTKTAQEETPAAVESPVVTLKRKQPEAAPVAETPVVTLKKKQPEVAPETKPEVKPQPKPDVKPEPKPAPAPVQEKKSNTGKIVGGIAAAAAILAGVYFFGIKGDDEVVDNGGAQTEQIAQVGDTAQPETAQSADATDDATQGDEPTATSESETPASVDANETPSSGDNSNATTPAKADENKADKPSTTETPASKPTQPAQSKQDVTVPAKQTTASAPVSGDVVENAKRVIRGDFGNGKERKDKLGSAYTEIQSKVNEMYRQGLVH